MTDTAIRIYFDLADDVDLDAPVAKLGFMSYREAAMIEFSRWGFLTVDNFH